MCSGFVSARGLPTQQDKATPPTSDAEGEAAPPPPALHMAEPGELMPSHFLPHSLWPLRPEGAAAGLPPPAGVTSAGSPPSIGRRSGPALRSGSLGPASLREKPEGDNGQGEGQAGEEVRKRQALGRSPLGIFHGT